MDIARLLDEPSNLNAESLKLLFATHLGVVGGTFSRRAKPFSLNQNKDLFKFFHNYFRFGFPLFENDEILADYRIIYHVNPIDWLEGFSNDKIEMVLCFFYFKKYVEDNFNGAMIHPKVFESLKIRNVQALQKNSYYEMKLLHKSILTYIEELNKRHDVKTTSYLFTNYQSNRDLNYLFQCCHKLYLSSFQKIEAENIFDNNPVSHYIQP